MSIPISQLVPPHLPQFGILMFLLYVCASIYCFANKTIYTILPEKAMAPHSSTLAWKIPWMEEPGRLQLMGSLRVRHH